MVDATQLNLWTHGRCYAKSLALCNCTHGRCYAAEPLDTWSMLRQIFSSLQLHAWSMLRSWTLGHMVDATQTLPRMRWSGPAVCTYMFKLFMHLHLFLLLRRFILEKKLTHAFVCRPEVAPITRSMKWPQMVKHTHTVVAQSRILCARTAGSKVTMPRHVQSLLWLRWLPWPKPRLRDL